MGFYGNITDTSRTHFQFDKVFNNRAEMDKALVTGADHVFAGRFVLVKYTSNDGTLKGDLLNGYMGNDNRIYLDSDCTVPYQYAELTRVTNPTAANWDKYYYVIDGFFFKLPSQNYFNENENNYYTASVSGTNIVTENQVVRLRDKTTGLPSQDFYKCTGGTGTTPNWEKVIFEAEYSDYFINYNIDKSSYGDAFDDRGYDATVWQKIYSEGLGKFILIARLNAESPAIELFPEPPSMQPVTPYLDAQSTDSLYRLHVPTHWGLQIKEAEGVTQGTEITYPYSDQTVIRDDELIHADIYMNLGGDSLVDQQNYHLNNSNKNTSMKNEITLTPTGKSGKIYYDEEGNQVEEDMLELSIHVPAVGNMIDAGYDLIYGANASTGVRPRDIEYYDGSESDALKQQGNSLLGGKTYDLTTLAGNINTMHNILGQIIIPLGSLPDANGVASLSEKYLYSYNNQYYRRGYQYKTTPANASMFRYDQQTNVTENDFTGNKYYVRQGTTYVPALEFDAAVAANNGYYLRNINPERYTPIDLIQFESGQYYLKEGENYLCDNASDLPSALNRTYYTNIQTEQYSFSGEYRNDGTFYTLEDGNYYPSYSNEPEQTTYYTISSTRVSSGRYFKAGCYYYKSNDDYFLAETYDPLEQYWILTFSDVPKYGLDSNGNVIRYYEAIAEEEVTSMMPPPANPEELYIRGERNEYIPYANIEKLGIIDGKNPYVFIRDYYRLNITSYNSDSLYLPGVYYINNSNNDYIKSYDSWVSGQTYYLITKVDEVPYPFYIPDTYYYREGTDTYILSTSTRMTQNSQGNYIQYYKKTSLYVDIDTTGQCPHGYEWNDYSPYVPPSVSLYTKEKEPALILMSPIGEDTSTLYGLLLELNKTYAVQDEEIRDTKTLKGALNTVQDILYQIRTLKPGHILYVNHFGQIESSDVTIDQIKALL